MQDLAEARVEHFLHQLLVHSPLGLRYVNEQVCLLWKHKLVLFVFSILSGGEAFFPNFSQKRGVNPLCSSFGR